MPLIVGDCLEVLASLPDGSVDACVTDPPYELGFMGKAWDRSGVAFREATWRAVGRVLRPGSHLLAFGGTRTFHRIACAIEDASFEIRDTLSWMYGQGFPKSLDVSKAIDEAAGFSRGEAGPVVSDNRAMGGPNYERTDKGDPITAAAAWSGWGTALKPAWEPIIMARKPLIGTVAENVLRHGTGGINVDGCRLDLSGQTLTFTRPARNPQTDPKAPQTNRRDVPYEYVNESGRWPANVALDEEAAAMLDEQTGEVDGGFGTRGGQSGAVCLGQNTRAEHLGLEVGYGDSGGASRFFYVAKASRAEREEGCHSLPLRTAGEVTDREDGTDGLNSPRAGAGRTSGARNYHPTVKPIELMRWLVRLVTPPGGMVLDPFAGSGTTGIACDLEGFAFTGIELDPEYARIAQARLDYWRAIPKQMLLMESR